METNNHKRAINAWAMYDWANSSFATTIMAAVLPVYYANVAAATLPENYALTHIGPIPPPFPCCWWRSSARSWGPMADYSGSKKRFLTVFCRPGHWDPLPCCILSATGIMCWHPSFYIFAAHRFFGIACVL